jgi:uncharacterized protein (DUF1501 family)
MTTTRREFLLRGVGVVGVGAAVPSYLVRTALAAPEAQAGQRVVLLLQLGGGNDALSMLVPYGHEEYGKVRQATRIKDDEVIKLNNELGLHPKLTGFKELFDQGAFAAIPGVGYPNPNYSHFTATDIWHTADQNPESAPFGWLGHASDLAFRDNPDPKLTIAVGTARTPRALIGKDHPALSFGDPESYRYAGDRGDQTRQTTYRNLNRPLGEGSPASLHFVAQTAVNANDSSDQIRQLAREYKSQVEYPKTGLGQNLRNIAALIVGGLSTRIYFTEQGGYDTHAGQRNHHDNLMAQLNDAVSAFYKDLTAQGHAERVLTFTTSEFGRNVKENGSQGTDHGAASAQFMFGPGVKPGVHGQHPSLTDLQGGGAGSLKHTVDFRSVYATVMEKWLECPSEPVLGQPFPLIDCFG